MRALTYYVAASLDGFIAGPDGEFDVFAFDGGIRETVLAEYPETLPTHARGPLGLTDTPNRRFDTVVMGRGTYEPGLEVGITSPYPHLRQYVVSTSLQVDDPGVTVVTDPVALVRALKAEDGLGVWLAGGGRLAATLREDVDALVVKRNPVVLGAGVPLFDGPYAPTRFVPTRARDLDGGVRVEEYAAVRG